MSPSGTQLTLAITGEQLWKFKGILLPIYHHYSIRSQRTASGMTSTHSGTLHKPVTHHITLYTFLMKNHDLKLHLLASSKMTSKSIRSMERYMSKQAKKNQKKMERMSIKDWHNVPSNEHGRSPTIRRLDPSSLMMDSSVSY